MDLLAIALAVGVFALLALLIEVWGPQYADDTQVLWLLDRRGREVAVPASRIAFVEVGALDGERKMGFGA